MIIKEKKFQKLILTLLVLFCISITPIVLAEEVNANTIVKEDFPHAAGCSGHGCRGCIGAPDEEYTPPKIVRDTPPNADAPDTSGSVIKNDVSVVPSGSSSSKIDPVVKNDVSVVPFGSSSSKIDPVVKNDVPVKISPKPHSLKIDYKNKKIVLSWKKVSMTSGYEIYRSTKKNGKYVLKKIINKGSIIQYIDSNLKKKTTYFYKIRSYSLNNGKKVYSSFSSVKSKTTN